MIIIIIKTITKKNCNSSIENWRNFSVFASGMQNPRKFGGKKVMIYSAKRVSFTNYCSHFHCYNHSSNIMREFNILV